MGLDFLDTSALLKRYVDEAGRDWVMALCKPSAQHQLYISQAALVEVVAALCRMVRVNPPRLDTPKRDELVALFDSHVMNQYAYVPVTSDIYGRTAALCHGHPLRAYDAIQLAWR